MPPIAPSQQGSRAGLITALVIFVILFVTSTIIAIHFYTQNQAELAVHQAAINDLTRAATTVVLRDNKDVAAVLDDAKAHPPETGIEAAIRQRNELAKIITSNPAAPVKAVKDDTALILKQVRDELTSDHMGTPIGEDNLLASLKALTGEITNLNGLLETSKQETKKANDAVAAKVTEMTAALAAKDKDVAAAKQEAEDAKAAGDKRQTDVKANVDTIQKDATDKINAASAQVASTQAELGKVQQDLKKSLDKLAKLTAELAKVRLNPTRALLQPAGVVTRVPGNNTVFINLGEGQQISPGLTFEVYDRKKGLPSLTTLNPDDPDALPAGKASLEVIRVLQDTSECRIVKIAPGQQIVEGDLCLNLIYNTHTKFNFVVYGDFDIAGTGQPTPGDAELIRRLITQWGGRMMDHVDVDTDFIVLGKEPTVNALPDSPTPLDQERRDKQQAAFDKYLNVESDATHLTIPVLNQNRFLYFVGYYDQAKR